MSDAELLKRSKVVIGYLMAHDMANMVDVVNAMAARLAELKAATTPGPATRELLELFREILARPHDNISVARMTMRAVIAEHEAAQSAATNLVLTDTKLVADSPEISPLLAAAKEALDDLISLDEAGWLDRGQQMRMERLGAVIAGHEAAQEGARR